MRVDGGGKDMHYSRHDFLKVAVAALPIVGVPWFYSNPAHAGSAREGAYGQARADRIHRRAMEEAIARAGQRPQDTLRTSK
jgi:hypothetical protein